MKHRWFVHRGFLRVWKTIRDEIKEQVINPNIKHIIVAGYSHGAAIAVLRHEYCVFNRPDIEISGYGFGAPRVVWGWLNKTVKRRFDNFYVIRNCRDIVTHVPPALFGYRPFEIQTRKLKRTVQSSRLERIVRSVSRLRNVYFRLPDLSMFRHKGV